MGVVLWMGALAPPFESWAARYEVFQSLQFVIFAYWSPVLVTIGSPWRFVGLSSLSDSDPRLVDRIAERRSRLRDFRHSIFVAIVVVLVTVIWRIAPVVDAMTHYWVVMLVEALTMSVLSTILFTYLMDSLPLRTNVARPARIALSAGVMWTIWIVAYLNGMSQDSWYHDFHHVAGKGLSLVADQQLSAGLLWFGSAAVFVPIVFANLMKWLQSEDDPDDELYSLVRRERNGGFFGSY